jgi:ubiquinone/menaquinone biosynthesis C-methylase UbiE/uncharacterized protein YbaR (Trm112 family)
VELCDLLARARTLFGNQLKMYQNHVKYLICPRCRCDLDLTITDAAKTDVVTTGTLSCRLCARQFPIIGGVPRFVPIKNYASGFGFEWTKHARTQYDSATATAITRRRFFEATAWPEDLTGETILEVGGGSGRFTEVAASTGALVVSIDYSYAVEANYASNGSKENVLIVQADLYEMPLHAESFDRLFCFGVLQHTPDVRAAFFALPPMLKPSGYLAMDVYKWTVASVVLGPKYFVRIFTRTMDSERLYGYIKLWIDSMWPISRIIARIPRIGRLINWRLLIADYSELGFKDDVLREWSYLDTFDMLAPRYDSPQTLRTIQSWFGEAGLTDRLVRYGFNGIEGRGRRPLS